MPEICRFYGIIIRYLTALLLLLACSDKEKALTPDPSSDGSDQQEKPLLSDDKFGADINPTGNPIGGGEGYNRLIDPSEFLVTNRMELLDALEFAGTNQIVYIVDTVRIDLTGHQNIAIRGGVTLASGRGKPGSQGALLYSEQLETIPLFVATGPNIRITGLRFRGPDTLRRTEQMRQLHAEGRYYSIPNSRAIQTEYPNLEVDNCELWGWSHAAVFLRAGSTDNHIHHNYFHHNQRYGLGYGVVLDQSNALIEANLFDWCRHHIAGTGRPGTSYEARYNLILENANSHSFDMHGGRDRGDGTHIAGDLMLIHHNTFHATSVPAVVIRGIPQESAEIYNNWFLHTFPADAIKQNNATGNMRHYTNQYTPNRVLRD